MVVYKNTGLWGRRCSLPKIILLRRPAICNFIRILLGLISSSFLIRGMFLIINLNTYIIDFNIVTLNSVEFNFIIILDFVSLMFMGVVTLIARCVVYYSKDYIGGDPNMERFIWLVFIFVISMMALITRPNLIRILLGWDGLGLVSYALVIYYQNVKSFNAGILTALSNRIGDVIILVSIACISATGRFNFTHINNFSTPIWVITSVFIVIAACTKSAQIPFSAWLPAAMAAPTPVSALVHSSTLVTAGVYLLIRFNVPIITSGVNKPLFIVAILTMLIAGVGANLETDLKKIIALSTLRQLGLIIMSIGLGAVKLAYFHILSHALFKALLFMCAGNIIHCRGDTQDLRKIGFIAVQMPITCACINTANLALCGAPFLAGFYSKDLVIETLLEQANSHAPIMLAMVATALTVTYSLRLSYYSMVSTPNNKTLFNLNDCAGYSCKAIVPLTVISVLGGLILAWLIFPTPNALFIPTFTKTLILPTLVSGVLLRMCFWTANTTYTNTHYTSSILCMMGTIWFLPTIVTRGYGLSLMNLGFNSTYKLDRGWVELITVKWFVVNLQKSTIILQTQQNNFLKTFILTFLIWFTVVLFIIY